MPVDAPPDVLETAIYKLPTNVGIQRLVFVKPLSCALHCVNKIMSHLRIKNLEGYSIGIVGTGTAGILIGLAASKLGADVVLINRSEKRLSFVQGTGLFETQCFKMLNDDLKVMDIAIITTAFITRPIF